MGQVSTKLRRSTGAYTHWCPGCEGMHVLPDTWTFNGDVESPTFSPSFLHGPSHRFKSYDERGVGIGQPFEWRCHYFLTAGQLNFCGDSSHALAGKTVPLPELPEGYRDGPALKWSDGA